ncbi:MAG TPA: DUF1801 domain-containing protein [Ignavibacteria bacterium]|nr:DUF1801 domain-containing protein [Ignavibacteria bacterium]HQY51884.1 DUF1801 domain-containing protein [Ignavibacteria bacterium]HRB00428.1 DUF1801 domain-containing protein [Ignavibacteria bacterium]
MITKAETVSEFMEKIDADRKKDLTILRKIIKKTVPGIKESMKYGMPTYDVNDKVILAFNSQKNYMSFYADSKSVEKNRDLLKVLNGVSCGKSCIRFTSIDKLPEDVITKIIKDSDGVC